MDKVKIKVKPAETHVKVQYEGEELTIKELIGKLEYLKGSQEYLKWVVVERDKEIALLKKQIADVQPVRHGQWSKWSSCTDGIRDLHICSQCGRGFVTTVDWENCDLQYCPRCGAKMDGGEDDG